MKDIETDYKKDLINSMFEMMQSFKRYQEPLLNGGHGFFDDGKNVKDLIDDIKYFFSDYLTDWQYNCHRIETVVDGYFITNDKGEKLIIINVTLCSDYFVYQLTQTLRSDFYKDKPNFNDSIDRICSYLKYSIRELNQMEETKKSSLDADFVQHVKKYVNDSLIILYSTTYNEKVCDMLIRQILGGLVKYFRPIENGNIYSEDRHGLTLNLLNKASGNDESVYFLHNMYISKRDFTNTLIVDSFKKELFTLLTVLNKEVVPKANPYETLNSYKDVHEEALVGLFKLYKHFYRFYRDINCNEYIGSLITPSKEKKLQKRLFSPLRDEKYMKFYYSDKNLPYTVAVFNHKNFSYRFQLFTPSYKGGYNFNYKLLPSLLTQIHQLYCNVFGNNTTTNKLKNLISYYKTLCVMMNNCDYIYREYSHEPLKVEAITRQLKELYELFEQDQDKFEGKSNDEIIEELKQKEKHIYKDDKNGIELLFLTLNDDKTFIKGDELKRQLITNLDYLLNEINTEMSLLNSLVI